MTVEGLWHRALESDLGGTCVTGKTWLFDTTKQGIKVWDGTRHAHVAAAGERINLRSFGAKDDNSTDNTEFLQKALNANIPVFVPPTASSFNFSTAVTIPQGAQLYGVGRTHTSMTAQASVLKYTGAGSAFTINAGGTNNHWGATVDGIALTTTTGVDAFTLTNVLNLSFARNYITGFSNSAFKLLGASTVAMVTWLDNYLSVNGSGIHSAVGGSATLENLRLIGNEIAGCTAAGGRTAALDFATGEVASMLCTGNDINFNVLANEVSFGGNVYGLMFAGNYIDSNQVAINALKFTGGILNGLTITGNEIYQSVASATGRGIWFLTPTSASGVIVRGNKVYNFAASGNTAIDPGSNVFTNSDFSGNDIQGAASGKNYGTFGAGSGLTYPQGHAITFSNGTAFNCYREDTFTATATGMTTSPTGTVRYVQVGNSVTLYLPQITGTSNATSFTLTGLPSGLIPARTQSVIAVVQDAGGSWTFGTALIDVTTGVIELYKNANQDVFTNSGAKALQVCSVTYNLI